jgi:hypothetical protein
VLSCSGSNPKPQASEDQVFTSKLFVDPNIIQLLNLDDQSQADFNEFHLLAIWLDNSSKVEDGKAIKFTLDFHDSGIGTIDSSYRDRTCLLLSVSGIAEKNAIICLDQKTDKLNNDSIYRPFIRLRPVNCGIDSSIEYCLTNVLFRALESMLGNSNRLEQDADTIFVIKGNERILVMRLMVEGFREKMVVVEIIHSSIYDLQPIRHGARYARLSRSSNGVKFETIELDEMEFVVTGQAYILPYRN